MLVGGGRDERHEGGSDLGELAEGGDLSADALFVRMYDMLRREAGRQLASQRKDHTLWATGLVHDVYLKLCSRTGFSWQSKRHFLRVAALAMKSILVDHARAKGRKKRTAGGKRVLLDDVLDAFEEKFNGDAVIRMLDLSAALERFAEQDPRAAEVVHLKFFLQLPVKEISGVVGVPIRSVERDWQYARAWLGKELGQGFDDDGPVA